MILPTVRLAEPLSALALSAEERGQVLDEDKVAAAQQQVDLSVKFDGGGRDADMRGVAFGVVRQHALVAPDVDAAAVHALELRHDVGVILQVQGKVGGEHSEVPALNVAVDGHPVLRTSLTFTPRGDAKLAGPFGAVVVITQQGAVYVHELGHDAAASASSRSSC